MRTTRTTGVALAAVLALGLGACGGGGDDGAPDFCDELTDANEQLADIAQASPNQVGDIVDALEDIDPPGEVEDAYNNVLDLYRRIADGDAALTDPALATDFANVQTDIQQIQDFTADECEPSDQE
jgi:hypothetical protein